MEMEMEIDRLACAITCVLALQDCRSESFSFPPSLCDELIRRRETTEIARRMIEWTESGTFPFARAWEMELVGVEQLLVLNDFEALTPIVEYHVSKIMLLLMFDFYDVYRVVLSEMKSFLQRVGPRVLMALLGVRTTIGCLLDSLPPLQTQLIKSFEQPHNAGSSRLSVGARALAKHCHRSSEGWFGKCEGSESAKNEASIKVCRRILSESNWINLHVIVGGINIVEFRVAEGYGARWSFISGGSSEHLVSFRGFLEPHDINGHERNWRH